MDLEATPSQINVMSLTERVASTLSLLGIFFILSTYLVGRGFDKPINRLIFFASWSNLGMNVACLIAEKGVSAGQNSPLCQFQAWAIQMFLGVDALWALCMAVNVYLALFRGWTIQRMRAHEWAYFAGCYGLSLIPAVVYLFIDTKRRGKVYGPALLWCWVSTKWDFLRVTTLYGIVWVALGFATVIYIMAFVKVWHNRHELSGLFNPFNENPFEGVITTEIDITSYPRRPSEQGHASPDEEAPIPVAAPMHEYDFDPYSVNVVGQPRPGPKGSAAQIFKVRSLTRNHALSERNADAWLYARVAFLFFCSLLICWVPSSINRLYSIVHPNDMVFGLNFTASLVLPLQGFFNAVIYIITSQTACRNLWRSMTGRQGLPRKNSVVAGSVMSRKGDAKLERTGMGNADRKLEPFTSRRTSERSETDATSTTNLREH